MKILVAEDDLTTRFILRRLLVSEYGAAVVEADNGLAALEQLARGGFDLVILDLDMPVLAGLSTLEVIRDMPELADLPVVILTADSDARVVQRLLPIGIADFMLKPVQRERVVDRLGRILRAADARRATVRIATGDSPLSRLRSPALVVDGDARTRIRITQVLEPYCTVLQAATGLAGLRCFVEENPKALFVGTDLGAFDARRLSRAARENALMGLVPVFALVDGGAAGVAPDWAPDGIVARDGEGEDLVRALSEAVANAVSAAA